MGVFKPEFSKGKGDFLTLWKVNLLLSLLETTDQCIHISFPRVLVPLEEEPMSSENRMLVDAVSCFVLSFYPQGDRYCSKVEEEESIPNKDGVARKI